VAFHLDPIPVNAFLAVKVRGVMLAQKKAAPSQPIQPRTGIAARNENPFMPPTMFGPLDGNAVGGVLRLDAEGARDSDRTNLSKTN
jgi:hypothetical protein